MATEKTLRASIVEGRPSWWERFVPAFIGFIGILIGGLWSFVLQGRQLEATNRSARGSAAFDSLSKIVDYRSRQINEFYYPLRLMLRRSAGVRQQLLEQLRRKAPKRFEEFEEEDGTLVWIVLDAEGKKEDHFRLIEHMYEIATDHRELLPLVKEVVNIGESMSKLIYDKGGLAIIGDGDLTEQLGRYLAHFSILRDLFDKAENHSEKLAKIKYDVAFPVKLIADLEADLKMLNHEIDKWKDLSKQLWKAASTATSSI